MKKVIKLTIKDVENVVKKVIKESEHNDTEYILAKGDDGYMYIMNPDTGEVVGRKPL